MLAYRDDNGTETLVAKYRYDAFGNKRTDLSSSGDIYEPAYAPRYTFSTKEYLSGAELYLYAYRVYDPIAGRWTQRDPIDYQDSINLYQFCGNNPVNGTDTDGRTVSKRLYTWGNFTTKAIWGGVIEASKALGKGESVGKAFLKGARDSAVKFTSKEVGIKDPVTGVISETLNQATEGKLFTVEGAKAIGSKANIGGLKAIGGDAVESINGVFDAVSFLSDITGFTRSCREWGPLIDDINSSESSKRAWKRIGEQSKEEN